MGAQIIGGLKTFNWRFCRCMPQTGPAILIASMKIPGNPSQQRGQQYTLLDLREGKNPF